jgi:hypothetical protein
MEIINITSYDNITQDEFIDELPDKDCLIRVDARRIGRFFKACKNSSHKYVVLSVSGDVSICYQKDYSVVDNMVEFITVSRDDMAKLIRHSNNADFVRIGPRYNTDACTLTDKYIARIAQFGCNTFNDEIPDNVLAWFGTNLNIDHPKITHLPFGINYAPQLDYKINDQFIPLSKKMDRACLIFSKHTYERIQLIEKFWSTDWMGVLNKDKDAPGIPYHKYMEALDNHKFIICAAGSGFDCYRTYEALYLGSIPVMKRAPWCEWMEKDGWPVILLDSLLDLTLEQLMSEYEKIRWMGTSSFPFDRVKISEYYWRNKIMIKSAELLGLL